MKLSHVYIPSLIAFFFIILLFIKRENFTNDDLYKLVSPENLWVLQGNSLPLDQPTQLVLSEQCNNNSAPSVTENNNDPHSLFEFTYNKCDPSCCKTSSWSCSGGCVCVNKEQIKLLQNRGGNRHITKCSGTDEIDY